MEELKESSNSIMKEYAKKLTESIKNENELLQTECDEIDKSIEEMIEQKDQLLPENHLPSSGICYLKSVIEESNAIAQNLCSLMEDSEQQRKLLEEAVGVFKWQMSNTMTSVVDKFTMAAYHVVEAEARLLENDIPERREQLTTIKVNSEVDCEALLSKSTSLISDIEMLAKYEKEQEKELVRLLATGAKTT